MEEMFTFDTDFNQDVSSWNTSSVTNMYYLFFKTTALNQDLGQWSLASVTDLNGMLDNTSLSTGNYDATLVGWANQTVPSGLTFGASDLTYDVYGAAARNTLTSSPDDWIIQYDSEVAPFGFPSRAPTQQATLTLTAVASNPLGQPVTLATSGGSGTGSLSFNVTGGTASNCAVSGSVLTATSAGTCIVTATKASDATYAATTSAPVVIAFVATAPPALPARLTIGFAPRSHALGAGARRALGNLSRKLTSSDTVTVSAYALHDASLARLRATAVDGLLKNSGARVRFVIITRTTANKSVIVTRA
jgi:surface protein